MDKTKAEKSYLTVDEAATILNTTPTAILMLLRRKELLGNEVQEDWRIERTSLEGLRDSRPGDTPMIECRSSCAAKIGGCASCGSTAE